MRAIINGFRFNTESAVLVGSYESSCPQNDLRYLEVSLYRTPRSGRFFLAGKGGPMTRFAQPQADGMTVAGSRIIPMSSKDALAWAEQFLCSEEIEEHFGPGLVEGA